MTHISICTTIHASVHSPGDEDRRDPGNIQGTFRKISWNIKGAFRGHSVRVEMDAREPPYQLQEALKESTG
jgi:hypothetical protein